MNILVLNGSPRGEESSTLELTKAFLKGMGEEARFIDAYSLNIAPCKGCFCCWNETPGKCVLRDEMDEVLAAVSKADLLIISTPQYCYSYPAPLKKVIDRMLPLSEAVQAEHEDGQIYHPYRVNMPKVMLIAGCGFPEMKLNAEPLLMQFSLFFGKGLPYIYCAQAPLIKMPKAALAAQPYLKTVEKAGAEFRMTGEISPETQALLDKPMTPKAMYLMIVNSSAEKHILGKERL